MQHNQDSHKTRSKVCAYWLLPRYFCSTRQIDQSSLPDGCYQNTFAPQHTPFSNMLVSAQMHITMNTYAGSTKYFQPSLVNAIIVVVQVCWNMRIHLQLPSTSKRNDLNIFTFGTWTMKDGNKSYIHVWCVYSKSILVGTKKFQSGLVVGW